MLYYMIWAFALFSLMLWPTMYFYGEGTAYERLKNLEYAPKTIGNLGYSSYECQSIPQQLDTFTFYCQYGFIGEVTYFGVNPDEAHGSCMENSRNK